MPRILANSRYIPIEPIHQTATYSHNFTLPLFYNQKIQHKSKTEAHLSSFVRSPDTFKAHGNLLITLKGGVSCEGRQGTFILSSSAKWTLALDYDEGTVLAVDSTPRAQQPDLHWHGLPSSDAKASGFILSLPPLPCRVLQPQQSDTSPSSTHRIQR